jgi:hypothetical protein
MADSRRSPRITAVAWGRLEVEGQSQPFKDAKLFPGGARAWDWGETGTHHLPGIQIVDIEELLTRGATTVVLSQGFQNRLQVCPGVLEELAARGIAVHVLQTEEAARRYNQLAYDIPVGGLFHMTC